jgi:TPR repeat protein
MSLENVTADLSLERNEYHKLELHELEKIDDAEALFQRGDRLMNGIGIEENCKSGMDIVVEAARRGHPVALGVCYFYGKCGFDNWLNRTFECFRASAEHGHATAQYYYVTHPLIRTVENYQEIFERLIAASASQGYAQARLALAIDLFFKNVPFDQETRAFFAKTQSTRNTQWFFAESLHGAKMHVSAACFFKMAEDSRHAIAIDRSNQLNYDQVTLAQ